MLQGTIVGVIRGGQHAEHEASLASGQAAIRALPQDQYTVRDIYIDPQGVWHERGRLTTPDRILPTLDVALVAVTGAYGASGDIQRLLERFGVSYTGSTAHSAFEASHPVFANRIATAFGIRTPRVRHIDDGETMRSTVADAARTLLPPLIVRPACAAAPTSRAVLAGFEPVHRAVTGILAEGRGGAIVEEHVRGPRLSVVILDAMRGAPTYALPAAASGDPLGKPGALVHPTKEQRAEAERVAALMHQALNLRHHSVSTFAVTPRGLCYLGTDPAPHMGAGTPFAEALAGVGISFRELFSHLVALARTPSKRYSPEVPVGHPASTGR